jgi:hypothetical protein
MRLLYIRVGNIPGPPAGKAGRADLMINPDATGVGRPADIHYPPSRPLTHAACTCYLQRHGLPKPGIPRQAL